MNEIEKIFSPVIGKLAWGFRQTHGSCFFVEFGEPHIETIGPLPVDSSASESQVIRRRRRRVVLHGERTLLVKDCTWELLAWEGLATQDTNPPEMTPPFEAASGQYLKSVEYDELSGSCVFMFDLGARLITAPGSECEPCWEQWTLNDVEEQYVSLLNNGKIEVKVGNQTP